MISQARLQRLFRVIMPHLSSKDKRELDALYAEIEKVLGYDAAKASRMKQAAKDRDAALEALSCISLGSAGRSSGAAI